MKKVSLIFILLIGFGCISYAQTVTIGTQVWMTKNLDVATFRNGDPIPQAKTNEEWKKAGENQQPAWCYYDNDPANGAKYGKLYNWYAVNDSRGLAPVGYHIPSDAEWTILTDFLGGEEAAAARVAGKNLDGDEFAGTKMKSTDFWADYEGNSGNGTNESGFSGLPGGGFNGSFNYIGKYGYWWSSTEFDSSNAWGRNLGYYLGNVFRYSGYFKRFGFSVRCLRD